jgi:polypeptide N-acetylgalactosaminyltransferase
VTLPVIDFIDPQLHYYANKPSRAVFDWKMNYNLIPRFATSKDKELEPFENPLMNGGVFAMHREYFFEIGPNDEGLVVYGAEQIDMSLRIWLCGGEILEVRISTMP